MCCEPNLVVGAIGSSRIPWAPKRILEDVSISARNNSTTRIITTEFKNSYIHFWVPWAVSLPSGTGLEPFPLETPPPSPWKSKPHHEVPFQLFYFLENRLNGASRQSWRLGCVQFLDVTQFRRRRKKKDLVGALKHLQLHKSNIQMTANVNTPLNKTSARRVPIGPQTIDLCPNVALCGKSGADLVRSGLVSLTDRVALYTCTFLPIRVDSKTVTIHRILLKGVSFGSPSPGNTKSFKNSLHSRKGI